MAEEIRTGTILIKEEAIFPGSFQLRSKPYSNGWRLATDLDRHGLDLKIREAAWTFYYTRGEVKASVFGFDVGKATRRAIERVLADLRPVKSNCLEITAVVAKRFLGLPYVTVSAQAGRTQEGIYHRMAEWNRDESTTESAKDRSLKEDACVRKP